MILRLLSFLSPQVILLVALLTTVGFLTLRVNYLKSDRNALQTELQITQGQLAFLAETHSAVVRELDLLTSEQAVRDQRTRKIESSLSHAPTTSVCTNSPAIRTVLDGLRDK